MSRIGTRIANIEKAAQAQNVPACDCHGVDGEALTAKGRKLCRRCPRCQRFIIKVALEVPGITPEDIRRVLTPPTLDNME
jgi:hypothetical protein